MLHKLVKMLLIIFLYLNLSKMDGAFFYEKYDIYGLAYF